MNREPLVTLLTSELDLLSVIDWLGPLDAQAISVAMHMPVGAARATAERLVVLGLLVLNWPGEHRPPAYAIPTHGQ